MTSEAQLVRDAMLRACDQWIAIGEKAAADVQFYNSPLTPAGERQVAAGQFYAALRPLILNASDEAIVAGRYLLNAQKIGGVWAGLTGRDVSFVKHGLSDPHGIVCKYAKLSVASSGVAEGTRHEIAAARAVLGMEG